jgi:hypothetical protein
VTEGSRSTARVIDPAFRTVARSVRLGDPGTFPIEAARPLAVTKDAAWVAYGIAEIARLEPTTGRVVERIPVGNRPSGVAVTADAVWVSDERDGTVLRIDPRTNEIVTTIAVGQSASGVAVGAGGVWVPVPLENRVKRIDPASNVVTDTVRVGGAPAAVAIGAGAVWVTSRRGGTVVRIDPRAARVTRTVRVGHSPQGIAIVDGAVWVAVQPSLGPATAAAAGRSDVLTVRRPEGLFGGTDPALAGGGEWLYPTCALLLNYPDRPFPEGARLVPEVARAMPTVSDQGRTYTFRVRDGFRFSPPSNAPVTAAAFRRAIERALHPRTESYAPEFMSDVVGFGSYHAGRAKRHRAEVAGREACRRPRRSLRRASSGRLGEALSRRTVSVSPRAVTPAMRIPMAGPYYTASYVPKQRLVLRRNPNYAGGRPARMREIDIDLAVAPARGVQTVEAGRADYVSNVPADRVAGLERRYGPDSDARAPAGSGTSAEPSRCCITSC